MYVYILFSSHTCLLGSIPPGSYLLALVYHHGCSCKAWLLSRLGQSTEALQDRMRRAPRITHFDFPGLLPAHSLAQVILLSVVQAF